MNTTDTETGEEGRKVNYWEMLAREHFPQYTPVGTSKNRYKVLAMEIEALRENHIIDRFGCTQEMCNWLTPIVGWEVKKDQLNTAMRRLNSAKIERELMDKYLYLRDIIAEEKMKIDQIRLQKYKKLLE